VFLPVVLRHDRGKVGVYHSQFTIYFNEEYNKVLSKTCIRQRMNAQCQKIDKIENKVLSKSPIELIFWVLDQLTCLHKTIKKEKK